MLEKIFKLPNEEDYYVITQKWTLDNLFGFSIYKTTYQPIYEVIKIDNDKILHYPWIAITPLRYAPLHHEISEYTLTKRYYNITLTNGTKLKIYCPLIAYIIYNILKKSKQDEELNYHSLEPIIIEKIKDVFQEGVLVNVSAWLVSCIIGMGIISISYNIP